jgi:hypothetical protein
VRKSVEVRGTRPLRKGVGRQDADSDIREFGIVTSVSISIPNALEFDGATAGTVAVMTVIVTAFGKALVGKAADATWSLLANRFDRTLPADGKIQVIYRPKSANSPWELVITYPDTGTLRRDRKNHRVYLAVAEGFVLGRVPSAGESIALLSAIPADSRTRPSELSIRHSD